MPREHVPAAQRHNELVEAARQRTLDHYKKKGIANPSATSAAPVERGSEDESAVAPGEGRSGLASVVGAVEVVPETPVETVVTEAATVSAPVSQKPGKSDNKTGAPEGAN